MAKRYNVSVPDHFAERLEQLRQYPGFSLSAILQDAIEKEYEARRRKDRLTVLRFRLLFGW